MLNLRLHGITKNLFKFVSYIHIYLKRPKIKHTTHQAAPNDEKLYSVSRYLEIEAAFGARYK